MNLKTASSLLIPMLLLCACEGEASQEVDNTETGGEAAGEVLGGSISDNMIPLDQLTSTSPLAERRVTTTTVTESEGEVETTVETTVTTNSEGAEAPAPTPPEPPAVSDQ